MNPDSSGQPSTLSRLAIDPARDEPLYWQIYSRLQSAITEGLLKPGERIASARAMATELGVARGTVVEAYGMLASEGYISARGQAGTIVRPGLHIPHTTTASPKVPPARLATDPAAVSRKRLPFQIGLPALDAFPRKLWARLGARHLRAMTTEDMDYPFQLGLYKLRQAIAAHLRVVRGIDCSPAQVLVTSGYSDTLRLIIETLLEPGDQAWVEDPGYPVTRRLLQQGGIRITPVPVDGEGLVVPQGLRLAVNARIAIVTPAHQSPLCISLSLPRRLELLDWASQKDAWVVEDDYDGEYRYASRPLPAMKSLDGQGRVLYAGTFSKVMFPGIRLAYLVVPEAILERFTRVREACSAGIPEINQEILASFMNDGHFVRHIHTMRKLYAERRNAAAAGLDSALGRRITIQPQPGGMHLVLRLNTRIPDKVLAERMRSHGLYAQPLTAWSIAPIKAGLLMGFTNIASQEQARQFGERMLPLMR